MSIQNSESRSLFLSVSIYEEDLVRFSLDHSREVIQGETDKTFALRSGCATPLAAGKLNVNLVAVVRVREVLQPRSPAFPAIKANHGHGSCIGTTGNRALAAVHAAAELTVRIDRSSPRAGPSHRQPRAKNPQYVFEHLFLRHQTVSFQKGGLFSVLRDIVHERSSKDNNRRAFRDSEIQRARERESSALRWGKMAAAIKE